MRLKAFSYVSKDPGLRGSIAVAFAGSFEGSLPVLKGLSTVRCLSKAPIKRCLG